MAPIPITIVTGFLGSGKTTLLLNLIPQLPPSYKLALLKNEFGDVAVDSQLASTKSISGVRELLNGCICCNLVGQLSDALAQLRTEVQPDRIVIETSGSAFPATLAMEVNRLAREEGAYVLDGVVDERRFDVCLDRVGDLEVETPWVKSDKGVVDKSVLLGIDGALFAKEGSEVEVLSAVLKAKEPLKTIDVQALETLLGSAPREEVYRIKGVVRCSTKTPPVETSDDMESRTEGEESEYRYYILNWAFGRWTCTPSPAVAEAVDENVIGRLTFILARYESAKWKKKLDAGGLVQAFDSEAELTVERLN
ncbi:hypothetical protein N7470_004788 [Penicillium chermesinum]|nr:hypothetical protein N7470_004788 [Penicillium chermesinum]